MKLTPTQKLLLAAIAGPEDVYCLRLVGGGLCLGGRIAAIGSANMKTVHRLFELNLIDMKNDPKLAYCRVLSVTSKGEQWLAAHA